MRIGAVFSQADSGIDPDAIGTRRSTRDWESTSPTAAQPGLSYAEHLQAVIDAKPEIDQLVG